MSWNPFAKKIKKVETPPPEYDRTSFIYLPPYPTFDFGKQEKKVIKQAHCENCGAPLNPAEARCEYCKTYWKEENNYVLESL